MESMEVFSQKDSSGFNDAVKTVSSLLKGLEKVIKGRSDTLKLVLTALTADGHVLLEDYPGSGKTTLTKTLGKLIERDGQEIDDGIVSFKRIQFTPDMLPGDVLGVNVFDPHSGTFSFLPGPVFAHIVLADEINRTGPKVQAAFLECMAEKQVTVDNQTLKLDDLFFVIGTQNPLDIAGTYPLPLVQLDRFILKLPMEYVNRQTEIKILAEHREILENLKTIQPVCTRSDILHMQRMAQSVHVASAISEAIVDIVQATRNNPELQFGASTRAALMFQSAIRAWALVNSREYCIEDDVKFIAPFVLLHRLKFHSGVGDPHAALNRLIAPHIENLVSRKIS